MQLNEERFQQKLFEESLTILQLSELSGVGRSTINRWLNGNQPSEKSLAKISKVLKVDPGWLVDQAPSKENRNPRKKSARERLENILRQIDPVKERKINQDFQTEYLLKALEARIMEM